MERRPIKSRGAAWAKLMAKALANAGVSPNQVSILSVLFALCSGVAFSFLSTSHHLWTYYLLGAFFIQGRLICNLMDGMVAIEHHKKTKSGDIYNDLPDRFSDSFIIVGVGYGIGEIELGYIAANVAILTAYIRVLGASLKTKHYFLGPMAKPHRMALITVCALIDMGIYLISDTQSPFALTLSLWAILLGGLVTCLRRLIAILKAVKGMGHALSVWGLWLMTRFIS